MVISRSPFRISFFGGGSDYPLWFREHGGAVLAAAIDKYCYLTCRYLPPFFEHRYRVIYSRIEMCRDVAEIQHPAVRGAIEMLGMRRGLEVHHDGDLPARSGMGSSSAFAVGILHALEALVGRMVSKNELAAAAVRLEQDVLRENVGCQDQFSSAFGGLNQIRFPRNGEASVQPVVLPEQRLADFQRCLMLFFTGISRTSSDIAATFLPGLQERADSIRRFVEMVDEGLDILSSGPLEDFGSLLHEAWVAKRQLSGAVSSPEIDRIYERAREAGALGGKLLGAGGGGFMLLFVPPERRRRVERALAELLHVPFRFDYAGSQIIHFDREEDYEALDSPGAVGLREPARSA